MSEAKAATADREAKILSRLLAGLPVPNHRVEVRVQASGARITVSWFSEIWFAVGLFLLAGLAASGFELAMSWGGDRPRQFLLLCQAAMLMGLAAPIIYGLALLGNHTTLHLKAGDSLMVTRGPLPLPALPRRQELPLARLRSIEVAPREREPGGSLQVVMVNQFGLDAPILKAIGDPDTATFLARVLRRMCGFEALPEDAAALAAARLEQRAVAPAAPELPPSVAPHPVLPAEGAQCGFCGDPVDMAWSVTCPDCQTPHHSDCWGSYTGCTVFGCQGGDEARIEAGRSEPPNKGQ